MSSAEVVEPEREVELAGVVLDQRQLRRAHGAVDPAGVEAAAAATVSESFSMADAGTGRTADPQKRSARECRSCMAGSSTRAGDVALRKTGGSALRHHEFAQRHDNHLAGRGDESWI